MITALHEEYKNFYDAGDYWIATLRHNSVSPLLRAWGLPEFEISRQVREMDKFERRLLEVWKYLYDTAETENNKRRYLNAIVTELRWLRVDRFHINCYLPLVSIKNEIIACMENPHNFIAIEDPAFSGPETAAKLYDWGYGFGINDATLILFNLGATMYETKILRNRLRDLFQEKCVDKILSKPMSSVMTPTEHVISASERIFEAARKRHLLPYELDELMWTGTMPKDLISKIKEKAKKKLENEWHEVFVQEGLING